MKVKDKAYIAGLFDGEGTIHITNELWLAVRLRNTNHRVLTWISSMYGYGNMYTDKRRGRIPCYSLEFSGYKGLSFLRPLMPYLRIKKPQADLALIFQGQSSNPEGVSRRISPFERSRRLGLYHKMRQLNAPVSTMPMISLASV